MSATTIAWTDVVWNPTTGCTKVSAGCKHCYAEKIAGRFWGERKFTEVQCHPDRLDAPFHWRKPRRVFVNSMSDLFHEDVPDRFIVDVFEVMEAAKQHTFQVLTKRPERIDEVLYGEPGRWYLGGGDYLPNVHLGVSVEDQATADERIPLLLQTPAAVRFVSVEPLLGPVDLTAYLYPETYARIDEIKTPALHWVIVGGESGPGARPCDVECIRAIVEQCRAANVPCFVKQLGANARDKTLVPFDSFTTWANKAQTWLHADDICLDARGRKCLTGADFQRAQDEDTFPVTIHRRLRLRDRSGADMSEWPENLKCREFPR